MAIIKIIQPGWDKFNGDLEGVRFENGVSTEHLNLNAAERLGSMFDIVDLESGEPISAASRLLKGREQTVSPGRATIRVEDIKAQEDSEVISDAEEIVESSVEEKQELEFPAYTREQLEKIADEGGITKLREFAKDYDVKGNSIIKIIDGLMQKVGQ